MRRHVQKRKDADTVLNVYLPELKVPIAKAAHKQHTLFAKPVRATLKKQSRGRISYISPAMGARSAQRIAKRMDIPAIAAFHIQPENITYNISLKWFPPAAHLIYFCIICFSTAGFPISTARQIYCRNSEAMDTGRDCTSLKRRSSGIYSIR